MKLWRVMGYGLLLWGLGGGISVDPQTNARTGRHEKGWLDAGPSCVLPIDTREIPQTPEQFVAALSGGVRKMAILPTTRPLVSEDGDFPTLRTLTVDLTDGVEDADHKPPRVNEAKARWTVAVGQYEVKATPINVSGSRIDYDLTATDATLELRQDTQNQPVLLLTGASSARFEATVGDADIQALCSLAAKKLGKKFGFDIRSCSVTLVTPNSRQIDVKLHVKLGRPIGGDLTFTAQMIIGDDLTGRVTNISCQGNGATGMLISALLTPVLMLQNGITRPLLEFPGGRMGVRDVSVNMAQTADGRPSQLHIMVEFGDWQ